MLLITKPGVYTSCWQRKELTLLFCPFLSQKEGPLVSHYSLNLTHSVPGTANLRFWFFLPPSQSDRRYCFHLVCLSVCLSVCLFVCLFVRTNEIFSNSLYLNFKGKSLVKICNMGIRSRVFRYIGVLHNQLSYGACHILSFSPDYNGKGKGRAALCSGCLGHQNGSSYKEIPCKIAVHENPNFQTWIGFFNFRGKSLKKMWLILQGNPL